MITDDIKKHARALGEERPDVRDILQRAARFDSGTERFLRLLKNQCLEENIDISKLPPFGFPPSIPHEGIPFARILHGEKILGILRIVIKALAPLFGVFGASRTGKTMAVIYGILMPLIESVKTIAGTIFDPEGQYKLHLYPKYQDRVLLFRPSTFINNPFIPPSALTAEEWTNKFASLWRSLNCGDAMVNMLVSGMRFLYSNYSTPTFSHLKEWVQSLSFKPTDRAYQHRESLLSRINWLESVFGHGWDCAEGFRRRDIIDKWKIVETVGLDLATANFWQDLIIEREKYSYTSFTDEPREVLVFEEAHYRFGADFMVRNTEVGERVSLGHLRTLGKSGFVTIVIDQAPSLLAPQLIANLSGVLCFRLNNSLCIKKISDLLNLNHEQREAIPTLEDRKAIFFSHHSLPSPTLVQMFDFPIQNVTSDQIEPRIRESLANLHFVPREKCDSETKTQFESNPKFTATHLTIEQSFATEWFISLDERFRKCGNLHPEYGMRLVKDNQDMGFLGPLQDFGYGKGKPSKTAFVTEKGAELLKMDYKDCIPPGKGSAQHRYFQKLLKERLQGILEYKSADVVEYRSDSTVTAYEVELEPSAEHAIENIKRDLPNFTKIVVVTRNQEDKKAARKNVAEHDIDPDFYDIEFRTVKEVLNGTS
jgi:hypothetical protein